ncbi:hypothetical protein BH18ACT1_BH18ACT1_15490 [soil metagenome]|nr:carboxymuconolactone decarboxylase family protein [Acidimicrobiia bacterium]
MSARIDRLELSELPDDLRAALEPRVERLGYLGEFFRCAAHQPAALRSFMAFTDDLKAALPDDLTEVVALTVAASTGNDYERHQHERLCLRLGFDEAWVRRVLACDPSGLDDHRPRAVQELTLALLADHGHAATAPLERLVAEAGAATAVAVLLLVSRYVAHALVVNALELAPPVPSPLGERV